MKQNLYPEGLWREIKKSKKIIPRKLRNYEKLKLYKRYWLPDYGIIKVKDIINTEHETYYSILYNDGFMNGVIPRPNDECYELLRNFNKFEDCNFINKKVSVYGAEIKYWFLINNINENDKNFSGFLDKLQELKDSTKYMVRRNKKKKEYEFINE